MSTVVISAGHSTTDPGAVNGTTKESFLTMEITKYATQIMRNHGVEVLNVPDNLSLVDTIKFINALPQKIDACVEVHINAGGDGSSEGVEAWCYYDFNTHKISPESQKLSQFLVEALKAETGMKIRGVFDESIIKYGRLGFVHDTNPIASLVECGFINNDFDLKMLLTDTGRYTVAKGVARGFLGYIGVTWDPQKAIQDGTPAANTNGLNPDDLKAKINDLQQQLDKKDQEYQGKLDVFNKEVAQHRTDIRNMLQKVMDAV